MPTTRLSPKGQIVLPLSIRTAHAWKPGTEFTVEETKRGILLKPASAQSIEIPQSTTADVAGYLRRVREAEGGPSILRLTDSEFDQAIAKEVRRRRGRGRY